MKTGSRTITEYIRARPPKVRVRLVEMRAAIRQAASAATEAISYGVPTFRLNGKNLVHFAAFRNHISFFPTSSGIRAFKKELARFKTAKGTVQFPHDGAIPYGLIKKMTQFRVGEVSRASSKQ